MKFAALFSDHAVLQQGRSVPVWGWAKPGAEVEVSCGNAKAVSVAGAEGRFFARLPAMAPGGPYVLKAVSEEGSVASSDVWFGEVWLAAGQSNMELPVEATCSEAMLEELSQGGKFRMFCVPRDTAIQGVKADVDASWASASGAELKQFSAVASWFAKRIAEETSLKVGILNASLGGSIIEAWSSREALLANKAQKALVESYEEKLYAVGPKTLQAPRRDPGNAGVGKGWASPSFDDSNWPKMKLPCIWTGAGLPFSGVVWFRKEVELPATWAGRELILSIGAVDKQDTTYFNGSEVGRTGKELEDIHWNEQRHYPIPCALAKAGRNVIAVRAFSFLYDGGLTGPASEMKIAVKGSETEARKLDGLWTFAVERNLGAMTPFNYPHLLFDNMISPLIPYAIRGALWYQGESNGSSASGYGELLTGLLRHWRFAWGQGDFPFYIVQLANYGNSAADSWVYIREAQLKALAEPETGLAVSIDVGEKDNIHPLDKRSVGTRLALWALARDYGKQLEPSGPLFKEKLVEPGRLRLSFSHLGGGLMSKDGGPLKTFEIAGIDNLFLPAEARLEGDSVIVSSVDCPAPVYARYAWAGNPCGCNLCNKEGLPASPFRA